MNIDLNFAVFASIFLLLVAGLYCLIVTQNLLRILIALEVLMKAVTLLLIAVGYFSGWTVLTQSFVITLIIIEVVVMVIACGIIIGICKISKNLETSNINNLKG
jgi:NADH-quinone oxidoreductase subunit K